ncbi:IS5 family transposase [Roseomonas sp. SSH11]|uniref:IS5 family transposase n=1 Tax=Pararoseomonas baculiformis TaxID=2820812 RepID=A0ABS4ALW7_9PROT|nr:IS5 family transposase [Pararoseomonas baculiformis]
MGHALNRYVAYRARGGPLHLVIDSTGLKVLGEGEWKVRKHGADKRRVWRKVHPVIDADSHEVRAVEMTDHRHGDGEIVPGLLAQVPRAERIGMISGDGAYDTPGVYEASASRDAALVVPQRRNGKPWKAKTTGAAARNETLRAIRHLGRRLWKRWSGYHRRSLAETAMSRLKRLGERLASRPYRPPRCRSAAPSSTPSTPSVCPTPSPAPDQGIKDQAAPLSGFPQQGHSTGLKICGPGEWLTEKHGTRRRRSWRKLHLATDVGTGRVIASVLMGHDADDGGQVGPLLERVDGPVASLTTDGACDRDDVHAEIMARHPQAEIIVPPRSSAVPSAAAGAGRGRLATTGVPWSKPMCRAGSASLAMACAPRQADAKRPRGPSPPRC